MDVNNDGKKDVILGGNNQTTRIKLGQYSANHGLVLLGDGKGHFSSLAASQTGLKLRGDVRDLVNIRGKKGDKLMVGVNNQAVKVFEKK